MVSRFIAQCCDYSSLLNKNSFPSGSLKRAYVPHDIFLGLSRNATPFVERASYSYGTPGQLKMIEGLRCCQFDIIDLG